MKIGFVGLGIMGKPMAKNLLKAGYPVMVYNRTPEKADPLVQQGAGLASSPKALAKAADVIIAMVTGPEAIGDLLWGPEGAGGSSGPGSSFFRERSSGTADAAACSGGGARTCSASPSPSRPRPTCPPSSCSSSGRKPRPKVLLIPSWWVSSLPLPSSCYPRRCLKNTVLIQPLRQYRCQTRVLFLSP